VITAPAPKNPVRFGPSNQSGSPLAFSSDKREGPTPPLPPFALLILTRHFSQTVPPDRHGAGSSKRPPQTIRFVCRRIVQLCQSVCRLSQCSELEVRYTCETSRPSDSPILIVELGVRTSFRQETESPELYPIYTSFSLFFLTAHPALAI